MVLNFKKIKKADRIIDADRYLLHSLKHVACKSLKCNVNMSPKTRHQLKKICKTRVFSVVFVLYKCKKPCIY